jgi:hypothetical protein
MDIVGHTLDLSSEQSNSYQIKPQFTIDLKILTIISTRKIILKKSTNHGPSPDKLLR